MSPIRTSRHDSIRHLHCMLLEQHPSRGPFLVESHGGRDRAVPARPSEPCLGAHRGRLPPRRGPGQAGHSQAGPRLARRARPRRRVCRRLRAPDQGRAPADPRGDRVVPGHRLPAPG
ncbi:hypothetical protein C1J00_31020 [Streptomyces cahuitamycinicus]|uniref:Uncharacterized protein n=1 Tax=Streptomyces cahuitamycinicus TaxID=2070367 RepID=A0A2N8THG1_9ACTN|nr:hypothetical protein C1J00_31020 [Streptomyces cahuitamycinicus]